MGFRTVVRRMIAHRTAEAVLFGLRAEGRWEVPDGYEEGFNRACVIFRQQRVFDGASGTAVGVHRDGRAEGAGEAVPPDVARGIAAGRIDPRTREPFPEERLAAKPSKPGCGVPAKGGGCSARVKFVPPSLRKFGHVTGGE
jgi:hypothetical protein